jgi:sensor domain CHASE-containing protein
MDIINHGLKEFIVHHNSLGKNFLKSLSNRLKEDDYLRFLDIRYNKIGPDLIMKFLKRMNSNKYIVGIDLRGNQGYWDNETAREALSLIMQRNINLNLTEKVVLKKRWIIEE